MFKKLTGHSASFGLEITAALLLKFLLLGGLWWLFFAGNKQPVDEAIIAAQIFGDQQQKNILSHKNQESPQ
jgi:cbb3-type cytochrome oxidase subunit 3